MDRARTPRSASALGPLQSEWVTDTYTIYNEEGRVIEEDSTEALWPKEE